MMMAVLLNLIVAAVTGIAVPLVLHRARRDPAQGASVDADVHYRQHGILPFSRPRAPAAQIGQSRAPLHSCYAGFIA